MKIMWARTAEERARNRHSGFVCFYERQDAEDALHACDETDPFRVGRQIMVRWGRHVKTDLARMKPKGSGPTRSSMTEPGNTAQGEENTLPAIAEERPHSANDTDDNIVQLTAEQQQQQQQRVPSSDKVPYPDYIPWSNRPRINVTIPADENRAFLIATVAQYVASDGVALEQRLMAANTPGSSSDGRRLEFLWHNRTDHHIVDDEHIYYQWRVFSFLQGDSMYRWRTEPFVRFEPNGCVWIPPPLNPEWLERERIEQDQKRLVPPHRKRLHRQRNTTIMENKDGTKSSTGVWNSTGMQDLFDQLFRWELCASRTAVARAMAFCFEHSTDWSIVAQQLEQLLLETTNPSAQSSPDDSQELVETKVAQLYVVSDVLFNCQQPGVKNAFRYRDAIHKMMPRVLMHWRELFHKEGRWTQQKISLALSSVLAAWTNWSVFDAAYMDELQARWEGKEVSTPTPQPRAPGKSVANPSGEHSDDTHSSRSDVDAEKEDNEIGHRISRPVGDWSLVEDEVIPDHEIPVETLTKSDDQGDDNKEQRSSPITDTQSASNRDAKQQLVAGAHRTEDEGEPLDDDMDADGEPLDDDGDADGEPLDDDADADGEPLDDDASADGESLDEGDDER